jgi:hypothetical protein
LDKIYRPRAGGYDGDRSIQEGRAITVAASSGSANFNGTEAGGSAYTMCAESMLLFRPFSRYTEMTPAQKTAFAVVVYKRHVLMAQLSCLRGRPSGFRLNKVATS